MKESARASQPWIRDRIASLEESGIRAIANRAMGMEDVIPLWFGEPNLPTPAFICEAASQALEEGATFYTPNRGDAELVETIADYSSRIHKQPVGEDRIVVTSAGMNALMIVAEMLVNPGDEILCVSPVWPNFYRCIEIMGGAAPQVPLGQSNGRWRLDLERAFDAVGPRTRAIYLNSPSNPTGWVAEREELEAILDFCRRRGLWVISDEVYERIIYDRDAAPSFLDIIEPEDAAIVVNSFSKSWAMTGWRIGWVTTTPEAASQFELLNEYNVASPASAAQRAGIVAIREGEEFIRETRTRYGEAREITVESLSTMGRVRLTRPDAAFYAFFSVDGMESSAEAAREILMSTKVGVAPGVAFGAGGEGHLRICYAKTPELLREALDRLASALN